MGSINAQNRSDIFGVKSGGLRRRWFESSVNWLLVAIILVSIICVLIVGWYYYSGVCGGLENAAEATSGFIENYISRDYNEFYRSCIQFANSFDDKDTIELQFIDRNGRLVASSYAQWSGIRIDTEDVSEAILTGATASFTGISTGTGERIAAVSVPLIYRNGEIIGVLRYVTSLRLVDRQVGLICFAVAAVALLFILLILIGTKAFLQSILDPIAEITSVAKRIAAGSYGSHILKISNDEIGVLSEAINDMSDAVNRAERMQSEFVSSVSHELRTPLTVINGWGVTLLEDPNMSREDFERGMGIILSETTRLTGMVEELLEFTRVQDGRMVLNVQDCDLRPELEDTIFMYMSKLKSEGISLEYLDNDDDVPEIPCDISRLRQVFFNVLDNAVKHGGAGKRITVEILRHDREISICIRDFGPGIPEEELPLVKSKFYKGSSKARGNGIGLAVCDEIMRLHGGDITLSNADGGGTKVELRLPINKATEEEP